jgi:hypothetical protein
MGAVSGAYVIGGLVGSNSGVIANSYAISTVFGYGAVGGLVGSNVYAVINSSYSVGSVSGVFHVGGLVGNNFGVNGAINNSFAMSNVSGIGNGNDNENAVGGLVGRNTSSATVNNSYAVGYVFNYGGSSTGALVGLNKEGGSVANSYFNNHQGIDGIGF